jgi:hypothetical protein
MWPEDARSRPNSATQSGYAGQERRTAPRIETPFPLLVRSIDIANRRFEEHTVLDNLSSGGLYLRLAWRIRLGARLFALVQIAVAPDAGAPAACVALHGVVLRTEPRPGGVFGTAIRLTHHRFIYAAAERERIEKSMTK